MGSLAVTLRCAECQRCAEVIQPASLVRKMQTSESTASSECNKNQEFYIVVETCKFSIQFEWISSKLELSVRNISFVLHKNSILWFAILLRLTCDNSEINFYLGR